MKLSPYLEDKVKRQGECLVMSKNLTRGYGRVHIDGKRIRATHHQWEFSHATKIPEGKIIRHTCDNPPCVNPEHLLVGTHKENTNDMIERGRRPSGKKDICKRGHIVADNIYTAPDGKTRCGECIKVRRQEKKGSQINKVEGVRL